MKTKFSRFGKILVASCSVAWLGAAAEPDSPIPTTVVPATADSSAAVRPAVGTLPANFKPSPKLDEIIRLAQAGVSEDVLLAYIAKAQRDFSPSSEEIIFLHDLGVTDNVITTLIKSKPGATASAPAPAPAPAPQGVAANAAPPALNGVVAQPAPPEGTATVVIQQPAQQVTVNYFYEELQPYGNWVQVSDYGWCWQPTVVVANAGWRPYGDRGRWLWTTSGWYWQSDYSWGWAPFHYGRWYCHPRYSWVWVPETTWGPSWVSWRYSSSHCGWAPLPPAARFNSGIGFTYFGGNVGVGFEFGLSFGHYTYVPANRFCDRNPWVHRVPESHTKVLYQNTTVVNNYVVGNNNTIINHGAGRETIARSVAKPIPTIAVRDVPENLHGHARADRITTEGSQQFIYRTSLSKPATTPSQLTGRSSVEGKSLSTQSPAVSAPVPNGRTPAANRQNIVSKGSPSVPEGSRTFQPNQPSLLEQRTAQPGQSTPADRVNPRKNSKSPEKTTALPGARAIEQTPAPTLVRPPAPAAVSVPATLKPTVQSPTIIREQRSGNDRSLNQPQSNPPARQPNAQPLADSRPQVQYTPRITQPVQTQRYQIPTTPAPAPRVESAPARSTPPASNNNSGRNDDGNAGQGGKSGKGRDR